MQDLSAFGTISIWLTAYLRPIQGLSYRPHALQKYGGGACQPPWSLSPLSTSSTLSNACVAPTALNRFWSEWWSWWYFEM